MRWCRALLAANGLVWVGLGLQSALLVRAGTYPRSAMTLVVLMCLNALVLLFLAYRLERKRTGLKIAAFGWVALNLILSFTDQVGVLDLVVAGLNLVTLVALAAAWREGERPT